MKPIFLLSTGILTLLLQTQVVLAAGSASSASSSSAPSTLYDRIKNGVERDIAEDKVEPEVAAYVHDYMGNAGQTVSIDNVTQAVQNKTWTLCGTRDANDRAVTFAGCDEMADRIRQLVQNETRVRTLGRNLQLIATSYELPISNLPGRTQQMSNDLHGIISIWSAGTGSTKTTNSGTIIRTKTIDANTIRPLVQHLADALKKLDTEQQIAAVWRYQYGVRLVKNDRSPLYPAPTDDEKSGAGTERQYIFKQWPAVESALSAIWETIRDEPISPPLTSKEIVQYVFPEEALKGILPDNVILWGHVDADPTHPLGDVGLQWNVPLEPVLPSLVTSDDKAILGGNYPPDPETKSGTNSVPVDGRGICSDPTQQRGYLCRTFSPATGQRCPDDPANPVDPQKISLVTCLDQKTAVRTTISGPDVCRDTDIREDHTFDPQHECIIVFKCANTCAPEVSGVDATVSPKDANGVITICVDGNKASRGITPLVYHELTHAYQQCTFPPGYNPYDKTGKTPEQQTAICCELEGGGYRAQCDMAAEDGAFDGIQPYTAPDGTVVPINAETCAEALTNVACGPDGYQHTQGCYQSRTYPTGFSTAVFSTIKANPKVDKFKCSDVLLNPATMDPRVRDLIDAIETRRDVCAPGYTETFKNTIGNNMCYIGQCIEESTEVSRVTGAQSPATVGDQAYPWNDPQTGVPLGNAILNPPLTPAVLPVYRPQLVVQQLESELCQLQGLPPLTPSILCIYNPARRLMHPITDPIANANSMLVDAASQADATSNTLALSLGLGSRLGTTLYANYMHVASRSLADVLGIAVKLFKEMSSVDFPTQMCPTDNTLPPPVDPTT